MGPFTIGYPMFSSRFRWDSPPNRLTQLLQQKRGAGAAILDLSQSNPTRCGFDYPRSILTAFFEPGVLAYEPDPAGLLPARQAVSNYYASRGWTVETDRILLTASTSEAYAYLFKLLCNPGDEVLVPRPSYPLFEFLAKMDSVNVVQYPLLYDHGWSIDLDALAALASPHCRALILVNPNNPTGSYLKRSELAVVQQFCNARGLALISDEVFSDYALTQDPERVGSLVTGCGALTFCLNGLSKIAGLPQMKLGWIVISGPDDLRAAAMEGLHWISDTYLSVGTPVQSAASHLLEAGESVQSQIRDRTATNLRTARAVLAGSPATVLQTEGGWSVVLSVPRTRTDDEWTVTLLDQHHVLVQPGFFFDFESEAFLVLSLLTPPEIFLDGLGRLRRMLEE